MIDTIDNFLPEKDFQYIVDWTLSESTKWSFIERANKESKTNSEYMFAHNFLNTAINNTPGGLFYEGADEIPKLIMSNTGKRHAGKSIALFRAKANLYTRDNKHKELSYHKDVYGEGEKDWMTLLYYVNTNNGYTDFKNGEKCESVANRAVIFPACIEHQTVTQTDTPVRFNININYKIL
ncbi:hypothetical protein CMO86_01790 [Candidatus Woesearchaeota archaeon]|nr:hypothetical protein [Candidatus Woesearchaeota archaeon]|tara:strand:- start:2332 stop:2871 length:540 start_codon:yes stop_codon:yes gene_type:complete